ncbi:MAG: TIGR00296 family protein [Candidatus Micrarchaeaceae archaeon]
MAGGMEYSLEDGITLVKAARSAIELHIKSPRFNRKIIERHISRFGAPSGVFVTIGHYPTMTLRGCIGFPNPSGPLNRQLVDAAIAASSEDARFAPVSHLELEEIVIEISILTNPEEISQKTEKGRLGEVKVGRDGLMIRYGFRSGILLPEVPIQEGWSKEEFLQNVCMKAGLSADAWKRPEIELYKFTAKVFREKEPSGMVEELQLG